MIKDKEKNIILSIAKKYNLSKILLFGSALENSEYNDIDIAIEGISPELFFKFYGEIIMALSKPVDVVNLDGQSSFIDLIKREGVPLNG